MTLAEAWPYLRDFVAFLGGGFALYSYRQGQQQRRAEWLDGLYTRFYEQAQYKRIRRILDYEVEPDLTILRNAAKDGTATDSIEDLVDYLNFFEFLGSLNEMKQLSTKETSMMFDYYIKRMNDHAFVITFVETQGFERLHTMMQARRSAGHAWRP